MSLLEKSLAGTVILLTKQIEMRSTSDFLVNNNLKKAEMRLYHFHLEKKTHSKSFCNAC